MFFIHYIQSSSSQNSGGGGTFFGCPNKRFKFHCPCPYVDRKKKFKEIFFYKEKFSIIIIGYWVYSLQQQQQQGSRPKIHSHRSSIVLFCCC